MKTCVILYSKRHFDPDRDTELSESSAARIAREIYTSAKANVDYQLMYFDHAEKKSWTKIEADVLICIIDNLTTAIEHFQPKAIYAIAVNLHPMHRLQIIGSAHSLDLPLRAISESDGLTQEYKSLNKVDEIAAVGNSKTVDSYKYFYPSIRVRQTQYSSHLSGEKGNVNKALNNQFNVLVLMSAIGFRKGADIVFDIVEKSQNLQTNIVFHLVGSPSTDYWREKIEKSIISKSLKYHGWIDNKSNEFSQIIMSCDIALFPSREEGMVGTALECIDLGIPVVHSQMVGIDSSSEKLEIQDLDPDSILQKIRNLQQTPNQTLCELADLQALTLSKQFEIGEGISYIVNDWLERNPKHHRRNFDDLITLAKIAKLWISIIFTNPKIILVRVYYGFHSQKLAALRRRIKKLRTKP